MRFRQLISPTHTNLYDVCLSQAPFYHPLSVDINRRPDHDYARPWIDDPTISTALPRVQLFLSLSSDDSQVDIDGEGEENPLGQVNWAPTITTTIPETFECVQQADDTLSAEQSAFIEHVRPLIDETRLAALCCELVRVSIVSQVEGMRVSLAECLRRRLLAIVHSPYCGETVLAARRSS